MRKEEEESLMWKRLAAVLLQTVVFCQLGLHCLQPSSIRGLAAPWTTDLHCNLWSCALGSIPVTSPVHVFMLSIHEIFGLPLLVRGSMAL